MKLSSVLVFAGISFVSCSKSTENECLNETFDKFKSEEACENSSIDEYTFQGHTVYVLDHPMCYGDPVSTVMDKNCKVLGVLGTRKGITDINGEDFSIAKFVKNIWKK